MTLLVETFTCLLIAIVSSSYAAAIITEKIWIPAKVTDITAIESSSTHTHSVSTPSLTVCIGAAFALNWPKLACYYPSKATNQCILWGEDAFYLTSITMQPEGTPADCRVKNSKWEKLLESFSKVMCDESSRRVLLMLTFTSMARISPERKLIKVEGLCRLTVSQVNCSAIGLYNSYELFHKNR